MTAPTSSRSCPSLSNWRTSCPTSACCVSVNILLNRKYVLLILKYTIDVALLEDLAHKVMEEAADPASTFLQRLNNPDYTNFSKAFKLFGTKLALTSDESEALADQFESAAFREAVGEVNQSMRLSLNYENRIESIAGTSSSEQSKLYRLLGNVPMRTVMETALGLPKDFTKLDIDRQAEILKEQLQSKIGITDVSQLAEPEKIDKVIQRFHAMESINNGPSATTPGYAALTLLGGSGFGAQASENLFLSLIR